MKVRDIVALVREYLDEVEAVNDIIELNGSYPVERRILTLLAECAVQYMSGVAMGEDVTSSLVIGDDGVANMRVPEDFGRLVEMRMSTWRRSVYNAITPDSTLYERQQHIVTRGGSSRPVVAIVEKEGERWFELYSVPSWDGRVRVERAVYVPKLGVLSVNSVLPIYPDKEVILCYEVALRVARSYGRATAVELLSASLQEEIVRNKR